MTSLLGTFGLTVVVVASAFAAVLWGRAAAERDQGPARLATALALAGALGAVAAMEVALLRNDVALRFVADHSSAATPVAYRVSAAVGRPAGLPPPLGARARRVRPPRGAPAADPRLHALQPRAAAVVSVVVASFAALTMLGSHPFARYVPAPADGVGPNPLLVDHPAMLVHPPLLYLGYAGLVVPFGYAIAALLAGDAGRAWVVATRTWSLVAWVALTGGVLLGAWWSYTVLGWGGYWAWDPVENAALLPWLTTTALLHVSMAGRHRAGLAPWCVGPAGTSFLARRDRHLPHPLRRRRERPLLQPVPPRRRAPRPARRGHRGTRRARRLARRRAAAAGPGRCGRRHPGLAHARHPPRGRCPRARRVGCRPAARHRGPGPAACPRRRRGLGGPPVLRPPRRAGRPLAPAPHGRGPAREVARRAGPPPRPRASRFPRRPVPWWSACSGSSVRVSSSSSPAASPRPSSRSAGVRWSPVGPPRSAGGGWAATSPTPASPCSPSEWPRRPGGPPPRRPRSSDGGMVRYRCARWCGSTGSSGTPTRAG